MENRYLIITSLNNRFVDRHTANDHKVAIDFADRIVNHLFGGCDMAEVTDTLTNQVIHIAYKRRI